jgi:hypothetical protein
MVLWRVHGTGLEVQTEADTGIYRQEWRESSQTAGSTIVELWSK